MTSVTDNPESSGGQAPGDDGAPAADSPRWADRLGSGLEVAFLLVVVAMLVSFSWLDRPLQSRIQNVLLVFLGIVLEAMPFMLVGSIIGGLIEVFVSAERISDFVSRGRRRSVMLAAAMGIIFPVCECAVIPVVRRLVRKGVPLSAAVAYMLAGPIVNPIVLSSTLVAYGGEWHMALARGGLGYLVAVTIGMVMGRAFPGKEALVEMPPPGGHDDAPGCACGHDHEHEPHRPRRRKLTGKLLDAMSHGAADFLDVGKFLIIGAFVAALLRPLFGQLSAVTNGQGDILAPLSMMLLAFVLNLCSEADAFVAASLKAEVAFTGQLAFLVLGPMLDIKLLLMYRGLLRRRAIAVLAVLVASAVLVTTSLYTWLADMVDVCVLLIQRF